MVAGRSWAIRLIPGAQSSRPANPYSTPLILLLGLLVAGLLESFLLVATGLERRLEHRVQISDYEATHDPLTDLINRREFLDRLDAARERALQAGLVQVLLFLDLDGFKQVNDTGGHAAGDDLLRLLAVRMRSTVRQADSVARLGGDEFAVLLPDCPVDRGLNIADDLVRAVADCGVEFEGRRLGVTASVGFVAIEPPEPSSTDELLRQADAACYLAKRSGKSQVRCYEPGIG
jgi:diguanylate cyclase (GGDEF)-like protein